MPSTVFHNDGSAVRLILESARMTTQAMSGKRLMILLAAAVVIAGSPSLAQPKLIIVEGMHFDLGSIPRGSVVQRSLTLSNPGSDTLVLGRVDVSCGCTGTVVSSTAIPPHASGSLLITFNSKNFSGPVEKSVTIHSNAADAALTVVRFTATVIDEIALDPLYFFFRDAVVLQESVASITVTNNSSTPLTLSAFRTQMKGLTLTLPDRPIPPGASVLITGHLMATEPAPALSNGVFVTSDNPHQSDVYIPVYGNVRAQTLD